MQVPHHIVAMFSKRLPGKVLASGIWVSPERREPPSPEDP
jgi:hypothetical protein